MLKDRPYSEIKEKGRKYEVYILHNIYEKTFTDIARKYDLSVNMIINNNHKILISIKHYYTRHLSIVYGYETENYFDKLWCDVEACYVERIYAVAYFEKEFSEILCSYRNGEPGLPDKFLKSLPPFRKTFSKKTVASVIRLREANHMTFAEIGRRLRMTREKADSLYNSYYFDEFMNLSEKIMSVTGQKDVINKYQKKYMVTRGKLKYDALIQDYPQFAKIK